LVEAEARLRPAPLAKARATAALVAAAATAAWITYYGLNVDAIVAGGFLGVLGMVSAVDVESRRIPNRIVLPAAALSLTAVGLLHPERLGGAVAAAAGAAAFFAVPGLIARRTVGMGDAKLALLIGIVLGSDVVGALLIAAVSGGLVALALVAARGRQAFAATIPYGPFLSFGAAVALLAGGGTLYS
jgi:leader peptidase (prepilin peptidase)/N-methyltransferase